MNTKATIGHNSRLSPRELFQQFFDMVDTIDHLLLECEAEGDLTNFVTTFYQFDQFCRHMDDQKKRLRNVLDKYEKKSLPECFERHKTDRIRIPEIKRSVGPQTKYSVKTLDKDALYDWLRSTGNGDLITETVNASTLTSFCSRLLLDEGKEPPKDAAMLTSYQRLSFTAYKPKDGAMVESVPSKSEDF